MIAIIDYDMGNVRSVQKAFESFGAECAVTRDKAVIAGASHVVLPGVGAFKDCMTNLAEYGLIDPIHRAIGSGKPFLGICLGLQLLFEEGMEFGLHKGLGVIKGRVERFPAMKDESGAELKVPHMGWNSISKKKDSKLLDGIDDGSYVYFVHSYYARPSEGSVTLTTTGYGIDFTSAILKDNVMACQFHPEKSQKVGLRILRNFSAIK